MSWRSITAALVSAAAGLSFVAPAGVQAATATKGNVVVVQQNENYFYNYDFTDKKVKRDGVDWPIALLFYNNATINKVKDKLNSVYYEEGGPMYSYLNEDYRRYGYQWDSDKGRKTAFCSGTAGWPDYTRHYRIYADGDDRLYDVNWGYFVLGSTHYDYYECSHGSQFGWSENQEAWMRYHWNKATGWYTKDKYFWFWNYEDDRREGDHYWQNDGYASILRVN